MEVSVTEGDLGRDLVADLAEFKRLAAEMPEWVGGTTRESDLASFAREVTGPALRRAIAAEYRAECLAGECHAIGLENATLREDVDSLESQLNQSSHSRKCLQADVEELRQELEACRRVNLSLAERCHGQAETLAIMAEKGA